VAFDPVALNNRRQVLYRLNAEGSLLRETGAVSGAVANGLQLASGLTGLRCEWAGPPLANQELLVVVLTYLEGKHLRPIKGMVVCPGIRRN